MQEIDGLTKLIDSGKRVSASDVGKLTAAAHRWIDSVIGQQQRDGFRKGTAASSHWPHGGDVVFVRAEHKNGTRLVWIGNRIMCVELGVDVTAVIHPFVCTLLPSHVPLELYFFVLDDTCNSTSALSLILRLMHTRVRENVWWWQQTTRFIVTDMVIRHPDLPFKTRIRLLRKLFGDKPRNHVTVVESSSAGSDQTLCCMRPEQRLLQLAAYVCVNVDSGCKIPHIPLTDISSPLNQTTGVHFYDSDALFGDTGHVDTCTSCVTGTVECEQMCAIPGCAVDAVTKIHIDGPPFTKRGHRVYAWIVSVGHKPGEHVQVCASAITAHAMRVNACIQRGQLPSMQLFFDQINPLLLCENDSSGRHELQRRHEPIAPAMPSRAPVTTTHLTKLLMESVVWRRITGPLMSPESVELWIVLLVHMAPAIRSVNEWMDSTCTNRKCRCQSDVSLPLYCPLCVISFNREIGMLTSTYGVRVTRDGMVAQCILLIARRIISVVPNWMIPLLHDCVTQHNDNLWTWTHVVQCIVSAMHDVCRRAFKSSVRHTPDCVSTNPTYQLLQQLVNSLPMDADAQFECMLDQVSMCAASFSFNMNWIEAEIRGQKNGGGE